MQTRDFCFWLQGLLEVGKIETLDADQVELIKAHLDLVFKHAIDIKPKEMEHPKLGHRIPSFQDWQTVTSAPEWPNPLMTATC